jgi:hypothetical protein
VGTCTALGADYETQVVASTIIYDSLEFGEREKMETGDLQRRRRGRQRLNIG